jgi:uncharacterized membrane protein YfcA
LLESLLLLAVGCLAGAILGLYGQQLLDRALANVLNFPVVYSIAALSALMSLAIVTVTASDADRALALGAQILEHTVAFAPREPLASSDSP